jgi:hypothetical protein
MDIISQSPCIFLPKLFTEHYAIFVSILIYMIDLSWQLEQNPNNFLCSVNNSQFIHHANFLIPEILMPAENKLVHSQKFYS